MSGEAEPPAGRPLLLGTGWGIASGFAAAESRSLISEGTPRPLSQPLGYPGSKRRGS